MTRAHLSKLSDLQVGLADLSNAYVTTSSPYSLSNAVGNLSLTIGGTDSDEVTLSTGRYILYGVPYVTTGYDVEFTWQSDETGSFADIGELGKVPILGDGSGQNGAALAELDVKTGTVKVRLRLLTLAGASTDSGGYIRINRSEL